MPVFLARGAVKRSLKFASSRGISWLITLKDIKISSLLRILMVLFCFFVVTVAPILRMTRATSDTRPYWVFFLDHAWYLLLAALILKLEEKFKRKSTLDKSRRFIWEVRKSKLAQAVLQLQLKAPKTSQDKFRTVILECIAVSVSELLNRPTESIHANLLDFSSGDTREMRVVARTDSRRPTPQIYPVTDDFSPFQAIREAIPWVDDDIKDDGRFMDAGIRPYRSIVSIPVSYEMKAYGALTIDCVHPYAFVHRKLDIAYQVQPYIALLCLTYGPDSLYLDCGYTPSRISNK